MPRTIRQIRIVGNIAYVPLTKGYEAIIDAADVPLVDGYNWSAMVVTEKLVYAVRKFRQGGKQHTVRMHRVVMGQPKGFEVDHRDSNGLHNCRNNLRIATTKQNQQNARKRKDNLSGYKGVGLHTSSGKWRARIAVNGKVKTLRYFDTPEDAHQAYCEASASYHGDFGRIS
jgi:hypothetical protein